MRRKDFLLVTLLLAAGVSALVLNISCDADRPMVAEGEEIAWQTSLPEDAGRPVLVDFTADWCPPCKVMEQEAWPDAEVAEAARAYAAVKIDIDFNPDLAADFEVASIPTIILLGADGNTLARQEGYTYGGQAKLAAFLRKHAGE